MRTRITNGRLIFPDSVITETDICFDNGKIIPYSADSIGETVIDAEGCFVSPGFIDIHLHGGDGYEFIDGTAEAVIKASAIHAMHGAATIIPTLSGFDMKTTRKALSVISEVMKSGKALPNIAGVHLEGPYFSPKQCGAQDPAYIRDPDREEYEGIVEDFGPVIRRWSYAPERKNSVEFQEFLDSHGIIGASGHTDAELCHMKEVYEKGNRLVTHLYSCTSTVTRLNGYRHLGVIETAFLYPDIDVETIADGSHLPPELLKMIYRIKGREHMCLVSDAIRYGGCNDCEGTVTGTENVPYIIEDGVAKLSDRSAFAGSIATADVLIRTCISAGIHLTDAVYMMTAVPARIMGLSGKGSLSEGSDADLVIFDENINVKKVVIGGRVYECKDGACS